MDAALTMKPARKPAVIAAVPVAWPAASVWVVVAAARVEMAARVRRAAELPADVQQGGGDAGPLGGHAR